MNKSCEISAESQTIKAPPLLKWPGGKRSLLQNLIFPIIPKSYKRYYEPFFGGGALYFALQPRVAYLSDKNCDLIHAYAQVRDHTEDVIEELRKLKNNKRSYYKIRSASPCSDAARAARFIYLITLAFNGIYRVNLKGEFNVPYGYKTHLDPCDETRIRDTARSLKGVTLKSQDFEEALSGAGEGDLVYLDPPYTVAHENNGFIKYNAKIFSWDDQVRLANLASELVVRGCTVVVSNANHSSIKTLYRDFAVASAQRSSVIAASSNFRSRIKECIFYAGGKKK